MAYKRISRIKNSKIPNIMQDYTMNKYLNKRNRWYAECISCKGSYQSYFTTNYSRKKQNIIGKMSNTKAKV